MKKKSPPYAIIGAVLLGIFCIVLFAKWKKTQDDAAAAALAQQKADMQKLIDDANAKQAPVVVPTATNMRNVYYATQPVEAGTKLSS